MADVEVVDLATDSPPPLPAIPSAEIPPDSRQATPEAALARARSVTPVGGIAIDLRSPEPDMYPPNRLRSSTPPITSAPAAARLNQASSQQAVIAHKATTPGVPDQQRQTARTRKRHEDLSTAVDVESLNPFKQRCLRAAAADALTYTMAWMECQAARCLNTSKHQHKVNISSKPAPRTLGATQHSMQPVPSPRPLRIRMNNRTSVGGSSSGRLACNMKPRGMSKMYKRAVDADALPDDYWEYFGETVDERAKHELVRRSRAQKAAFSGVDSGEVHEVEEDEQDVEMKHESEEGDEWEDVNPAKASADSAPKTTAPVAAAVLPLPARPANHPSRTTTPLPHGLPRAGSLIMDLSQPDQPIITAPAVTASAPQPVQHATPLSATARPGSAAELLAVLAEGGDDGDGGDSSGPGNAATNTAQPAQQPTAPVPAMTLNPALAASGAMMSGLQTGPGSAAALQQLMLAQAQALRAQQMQHALNLGSTAAGMQQLNMAQQMMLQQQSQESLQSQAAAIAQQQQQVATAAATAAASPPLQEAQQEQQMPAAAAHPPPAQQQQPVDEIAEEEDHQDMADLLPPPSPGAEDWEEI